MLKWLQSLFTSTDETAPVTLDAFQGKWRMVSVGKNANFAPVGVIAQSNIFMTIEGDNYTVTTNGKHGDCGKIKLDTSQNPVHFDQHITSGDDAGSKHLGIVRMNDGLLENFQAEIGSRRPKKFVKKWNDGASLCKFKRVRAT